VTGLTDDFMLHVRIGVSFVNRLLDSMITSFMAIHLAFAFGASLAGILMFAVVGCGVIAMLAGGHLADTRGRRRTLLYAESGMFATFGLMAVAQADGGAAGAVLLYVAYLLNRAAASVALPASDALIVDITTPQTRKRAYTINYWAVNLALALGALLGAWLYNGKFTVMLAIASACTAGIWLSTLLFIREPRRATPNPARSGLALREFVAGYPRVLRDRRFLRLTIAATLGLSIEFQLINYVGVRLAMHMPAQNLLPLQGLAIHVDGVRMLGILRAENTILVVLMALFAGRLFGWLPDRSRLYAGIILFVCGYMVMAVSTTGWLLMIVSVVYTVGELMNVPVKQALLADLIPEQSRTRYMAVYNLNYRFAQMIATIFIALGTVVPPWGIAALYGIIGVTIILNYRSVLSGALSRAIPDDRVGVS
jgi:MFS transporter, DHA1 family, multidrug resistance protein B